MHNLGPLAGQGSGGNDRARAETFLGRVLSNRYRVDSLVAMGGLGAVYAGEHVHMRKRVAIKILHASAEQEPEFVRRFEREAIAGAHVQHPNVAAATDFGEIGEGSHFLVLEFIQGVSLSELIGRGPVPVPRALHIARQIASALEAIHAMGIVHRDLKPLNVMVAEGQGDLVKVIDFGFAKVPVEALTSSSPGRRVELPKRLTRQGMVFGTLSYLAPEAAEGMDAIEAPADLYALGLMLYEMVAGKHPFAAEDPIELFEQQRFATPPVISERAPGVSVPMALELLILRLLAKEPRRRLEDATAVIAALDEVAAGLGLDLGGMARSSRLSVRPSAMPGGFSTFGAQLVTIPPAGPLPSVPPPGAGAGRGKRRREWIGAGAVCAALVLGALFVGARSGQSQAPAAARALPPMPTLTVEAKATAEPEPAPPPPARAERTALLEAIGQKDPAVGAEALLALLERDPGALSERAVAAAAREATIAVGRAGGALSDQVFEALARRAGSAGLDVLYDVLASRGGTAPAKRAAALLREPEARLRATPEMRIAFELRAASCRDKLELLDRAVEEGDRRALLAIESNVRFCYQNHPRVLGAMQALRERLQK